MSFLEMVSFDCPIQGSVQVSYWSLYSTNKFCVNYESPIIPVMTKDIRLTANILPICHYDIEV